jgi:hypothetical protein
MVMRYDEVPLAEEGRGVRIASCATGLTCEENAIAANTKTSILG